MVSGATQAGQGSHGLADHCTVYLPWRGSDATAGHTSEVRKMGTQVLYIPVHENPETEAT